MAATDHNSHPLLTSLPAHSSPPYHANRTNRAAQLTLALLGSFGLWMFGLLFVSGILFDIVAVLTGYNIFLSHTDDHFLLASVVGWCAVLLLPIGLIGWWLLRRIRLYFWRVSRWVLLGCTVGCCLILGGVSLTQYAIAIGQPEASCDLNATMQNAIDATYPIATEDALGTAFAINSLGTLVTAYHVIKGANQVSVDWASGAEPVKVLQVDPDYDLAVLQYNHATPACSPLSEHYAAPDSVYAFGWPDNTFNSGQPSISKGIISRIIDSQDIYNSTRQASAGLMFVQTDAAINAGNSGGPLVNACGAVGVIDGISTSASSDATTDQSAGGRAEGISYAVSTKTLELFLSRFSS